MEVKVERTVQLKEEFRAFSTTNSNNSYPYGPARDTYDEAVQDGALMISEDKSSSFRIDKSFRKAEDLS